MDYKKLQQENPSSLTTIRLFTFTGIVIIILSVIGLIYGIALVNSYHDDKAFGATMIVLSIICGLIFSVPFFIADPLICLLYKIELNTRPAEKPELYDNEEVNKYKEWQSQNPDKTFHDYCRINKKQ